MNTTTKNRTRRLVAASILALAATVGTSTAHAAELSRSGSGVGVRADADVVCTSGRYPLIAAMPLMGTTPGYEWGQNVAWRYTITNADTGAVLLRETQWSAQRIATRSSALNVYGNADVKTVQYASLPIKYWNAAGGRYRVFTEYAWLTSTGWSYSTLRTDAYRLSQNLVGVQMASVCAIRVY